MERTNKDKPACYNGGPEKNLWVPPPILMWIEIEWAEVSRIQNENGQEIDPDNGS